MVINYTLYNNLIYLVSNIFVPISYLYVGLNVILFS